MFEELIASRLRTAKETYAKDMAHWNKEYKAVQESCTHERLGEIPEDHHGYSKGHPQRVCFQCGLAEIGRDNEFFVLTTPFVARINIDELRKHAVGDCYDHSVSQLLKRKQ